MYDLHLVSAEKFACFISIVSLESNKFKFSHSLRSLLQRTRTKTNDWTKRGTLFVVLCIQINAWRLINASEKRKIGRETEKSEAAKIVGTNLNYKNDRFNGSTRTQWTRSAFRIWKWKIFYSPLGSSHREQPLPSLFVHKSTLWKLDFHSIRWIDAPLRSNCVPFCSQSNCRIFSVWIFHSFFFFVLHNFPKSNSSAVAVTIPFVRLPNLLLWHGMFETHLDWN